jgi:hypothetical protein
MTFMRAVRHGCAVGIGVLGCLGGSAWAQPGHPALEMLAHLASGQWLVHARDGGMADTRMCLADGRPLIQLRHTGLQCRQFVVQDEPNAVTVSYTCGTAGSGMTRCAWKTSSWCRSRRRALPVACPFPSRRGPARGVCRR